MSDTAVHEQLYAGMLSGIRQYTIKRSVKMIATRVQGRWFEFLTRNDTSRPRAPTPLDVEERQGNRSKAGQDEVVVLI